MVDEMGCPRNNLSETVDSCSLIVHDARMAQPDSGTWRMAVRLSDGHLATIILDLREQSQSWDRIARTLLERHGIDVAAVTVADWHRQLTADEQATA